MTTDRIESMHLASVCERIDARLRIDAFDDVDPGVNGLQVGRVDADHAVEHVAFAVDAGLATIEDAAAAGADLLVVHHGLFWNGMERLTGRRYARVAHLIEADMALYAAHLPLDAHPDLGNAAGLATAIGLRHRNPFGTLGDNSIGLRGAVSTQSPTEFKARLESTLDIGDGSVTHLPFGPDRIETVALVPGAGGDWFDEAVAAEVDAFITGEAKARVYHQGRESGLHVYLAGHYATETFGVRSLQELVDGWKVETSYIHHPTGL